MDKEHHVHHICIKSCIHLHRINCIIWCCLVYIFRPPVHFLSLQVLGNFTETGIHRLIGQLKFEGASGGLESNLPLRAGSARRSE